MLAFELSMPYCCRYVPNVANALAEVLGNMAARQPGPKRQKLQQEHGGRGLGLWQYPPRVHWASLLAEVGQSVFSM